MEIEEVYELQRIGAHTAIQQLINLCYVSETPYVPLEYLLMLEEVLKDTDTLNKAVQDGLDKNPELYNLMHDALGEETFKKAFYPDK